MCTTLQLHLKIKDTFTSKKTPINIIFQSRVNKHTARCCCLFPLRPPCLSFHKGMMGRYPLCHCRCQGRELKACVLSGSEECAKHPQISRVGGTKMGFTKQEHYQNPQTDFKYFTHFIFYLDKVLSTEMAVPMEQELRTSVAQVRDGCKVPHVCWEVIKGPLQK